MTVHPLPVAAWRICVSIGRTFPAALARSASDGLWISYPCGLDVRAEDEYSQLEL